MTSASQAVVDMGFVDVNEKGSMEWFIVPVSVMYFPVARWKEMS